MFTHLHYKLRFGSYLKNDHGIKKFAERTVGELVRKVTKKSAFYDEMNENLLVEKANLRRRADELKAEPMLDAGEFFSMRRRLWANVLVAAIFAGAAVFMSFLSVNALVEGASAVAGIVRWITAVLLALVLTGGGLLITERLLESIIPGRNSGSQPKQRGAFRAEAPALLWGLLLIALEAALVGVADVEARRLAAEGGSTLLYYGYLVLALTLPVAAGAVRWDAMRYIDVYKTTKALRAIEGRLAQIDSVLRQNDEYESNFYKLKSIAAWDQVNDFKTFKDNLNGQQGLTEGLRGHFAQSYDAFQQEASKRYGDDIRDVAMPSMRRLEPREAETVNGGDGHVAAPVASPRGNGEAHGSDGHADSSTEPYLDPKPIR